MTLQNPKISDIRLKDILALYYIRYIGNSSGISNAFDWAEKFLKEREKRSE